MTTSPHNNTDSFRKLFSTGVVSWISGCIALFAASWVVTKPESGAEALMWAISYSWIAFIFGFVVLVLRGVLTKESLGSSVLAYLLPAGVTTVLAMICLAIYPDEGLRRDLLEYLPVVVCFYLFGFLWMSVRKADGAFVRAVLPPVLAGLMIIAFVAVPVFTSNAFLYRNAFEFTVLKSTNSNGTTVTEGVLEIRKSGHYQFSAPHFSLDNYGMASAPEAGKITWGAAGEPKQGMIGRFPIIIQWRETSPSSKMQPMPDLMNTAVLEVRNAGAPETIIYSLSAQLPSDVK